MGGRDDDATEVGDRGVRCCSAGVDRLLACAGRRPRPPQREPVRGTITLDTVDRLEPAWTYPLAGGAAGHPIAAGDGLVHVASPGRLYTLATTDGTERWTHDAPAGGTIDPVIVRGPGRVDRPEGIARLGYSTSDPLIGQRVHWVDPLTGSGDAINGPGGGTIDGIRGGWGLTVERFTDSTARSREPPPSLVATSSSAQPPARWSPSPRPDHATR